MSELLSGALGLAGLGWSVFPLRPGRKDPATHNGYKSATTDPERITTWWSRNPNMNVGVATGASRLVVVDLDAKDLKVRAELRDTGAELVVEGTNGPENFARLLAEREEPWPVTRESNTPNGGHLMFDAPEDEEVPNSAGRIAPGIDVRGVGGYVVAPPSIVDGVRYTWETEVPVAPLPGWLLDLARKPRPSARWTTVSTRSRSSSSGSRDRYASTALDAEAGRVATAPEGQRNHELVRAAFSLGQLVGSGDLDAAEVVERLTIAALRAGLDPGEVPATIASGLEAGKASPRSRT